MKKEFSHESGTSASGTSVATPTGDGIPNAVTAFHNSVREAVREELRLQLPIPASAPQDTALATGTSASALSQEGNAGRLLVSCLLSTNRGYAPNKELEGEVLTNSHALARIGCVDACTDTDD